MILCDGFVYTKDHYNLTSLQMDIFKHKNYNFVHMNLCNPMPPKYHIEVKYTMTFIDDSLISS